MAVQLINIGNIANDGTGDDLREAFIKTNANFEELDLRDDEKTTATNLGDSGQGLFVQRLNYDLQFKKIVGGAGLTLSVTDDNITINNNKVYDLTQLLYQTIIMLQSNMTLKMLEYFITMFMIH